MTLKILILGGSAHGRLLAEHIARQARWQVLLSFAGRTTSLQRPAAPIRVGGFGGVDGLRAFLHEQAFNAVIDATHAFAAQMSSNAVQATATARVPLLRIEDPPWQPIAGDRWHEVADVGAAAAALANDREPRRVWLTIGRQEAGVFRAAPQHAYLVRAVDHFPLALPDARILLARGPFALPDERELLAREAIDVVVSKNAGTPSTYAKLEAARERGVPVIMVRRPVLPPAHTVATVEEALRWLEQLHGASTRRGE